MNASFSVQPSHAPSKTSAAPFPGSGSAVAGSMIAAVVPEADRVLRQRQRQLQDQRKTPFTPGVSYP